MIHNLQRKTINTQLERGKDRERKTACAKNLLQQSLLGIQGQRLLDGSRVFDSLIMTARGVSRIKISK